MQKWHVSTMDTFSGNLDHPCVNSGTPNKPMFTTGEFLRTQELKAGLFSLQDHLRIPGTPEHFQEEKKKKTWELVLILVAGPQFLGSF